MSPSSERSTSSKYPKHDSLLFSPDYKRLNSDFNNSTAASTNIPNFYPHSVKLNTESIYPTFSRNILSSSSSICNNLWSDKPNVRSYLNQPTSTSTRVLPRFDNTNSTLQLARQKVSQNTEPLISTLPKHISKFTKNAPNNSNPKQLEDEIEKCTTLTNVNTIQPNNPSVYSKDLFIFGEDTSYLGFPVISRRYNKEFVCMLCYHHSTSTCYSRHLMNHIKVICIFCQKVMNTYVLLSHLFMEHSLPEKKLTKCSICNNKGKNTISSYPKLFRHILTIHYRLNCPVCPSRVGLFTFESHVDKCVEKLVEH